jgi:hypothetical protein
MSDIRNNQAESRYELDLDGARAIAVYRRHGDVVTFTLPKCPSSWRGMASPAR